MVLYNLAIMANLTLGILVMSLLEGLLPQHFSSSRGVVAHPYVSNCFQPLVDDAEEVHAAFLRACGDDVEATLDDTLHFGAHSGGETWYRSVRVEWPAKPTAMVLDCLPALHFSL